MSSITITCPESYLSYESMFTEQVKNGFTYTSDNSHGIIIDGMFTKEEVVAILTVLRVKPESTVNKENIDMFEFLLSEFP